jgi:ABC-type multidrug transport system ATPase subunit
MKILEVTGLKKSFGEIQAVNGLNFSVNQGDIYGLLGVNGSGKSTTIRMLLNLIKPDDGEIFISGEKAGKNNLRIRRKIGALIERPDFYEYLSANKNLEILMRYSGMKTDKNKIREAIELVGLEKFAHKKVRIFSMGMKQRLGIAQALIHDPELMILDEPTNGLDPFGMVDIRNLIKRLNQEHDKTIILSSHILKEIELIASRMLIIHEGKAIAEGRVSDLLQTYEPKVRLKVSDVGKSSILLKKAGFEHELIDKDQDILCHAMDHQIAEINRLLIKNNIDVSAIIPERSLEDYFISLT